MSGTKASGFSMGGISSSDPWLRDSFTERWRQGADESGRLHSWKGQDAWWRIVYRHREKNRVVHLRLGYTADGRLVCTGLLLGVETADAIETTDLRIPLARIVSGMAEEASKGKRNLFALVIKRDAPPGINRPRVRPGPAGHPASFYERIATAYRAAERTHPTQPTRELIRQHPDQSEAAVKKWVGIARQRGLIPPYIRGRRKAALRSRRKGGKR